LKQGDWYSRTSKMYWSGHSSLNMDGQRHLRLPALYNMQLLDFCYM